MTTDPRVRLDALLVERGLFESRAKAQAAIAAGGVFIEGVAAVKPSQLVSPNAAITAEAAFGWVSRGGLKLDAALNAFGVMVEGRFCLDVGASTGGFTHVLVARGAAHVTAVDVGRGQMHAALRDDPRITVLEGLDARALTENHLPRAPSVLVCDASFIAIGKILPPVMRLADAACDAVVLVKPQFEAGREVRRDKRGLIAPNLALEIATSVCQALDGCEGFALIRAMQSPILGGEGALEVLAHLRRGI